MSSMKISFRSIRYRFLLLTLIILGIGTGGYWGNSSLRTVRGQEAAAPAPATPTPAATPEAAAAAVETEATKAEAESEAKEEEESTEPAEEEVFLSNFDPSKSFSKLLLPYVADRIGLSDLQKTEVTHLMDQRATELAKAERKDWPQIVLNSEAALKDILSPQQLARFQETLAEKKITLRFNKERWEDVLKWISRELGLQLVMDAPPAGTFNYNDKNPYSPKEALDKINGALQFKGYTLFRTGEMLYLHNFKSGPIPLQFLPKITPEELPDQSPFDYVALTLPLERRSLAVVTEVIKPFKGPFNTTRVLSGNSLLIVDSVNALREILPVALGVYNPALPATSAASPVPEWRTYPLVNTKPSVVKTQVEIFAPTAKPLVNPSSNQISYLTIPAYHAIIDGIIQRLEEGADPSKDLTTEVYSLNEITNLSQDNLWAVTRRLGISTSAYFTVTSQLAVGQDIAAALEKMTPDANIVLNPLTKQLVVVADPQDQAKIHDAVEKLKAPIADRELPLFKTFRFEDPAKTMSTTELSTLRSLAPLAQISFDAAQGTLLAVGTELEQAQIAKAVEDMNASYLKRDNKQVLAVYPMTAKQLDRFTALFVKLSKAPEMDGVVRVADGSVNQLSVWATARQQEEIRRIVEQICGSYLVEMEKQGVEVPKPQGLPPIAPPSFEDPAATPAPAPAPTEEEKAAAEKKAADDAAAKAAADKAAAEKKAADDAAAKAAADKAAADKAAAEKKAADDAAAKAAAEKKAAEIAEGIKAGIAKATAEAAEQAAKEEIVVPGMTGGVYLSVIRLEKATPSSVATLLTNTIPGIEVTVDTNSKSLVVYGTKTMIAAARKTVEQMERGQGMVMDVIPLPNSFPATTLTAVQRIEPTVTITRDPKGDQIFLFGNADGTKRVKEMIAGILAKTPQENVTVYYLDVTKEFPETTIDFLKRTVPRAEINYDKGSKRFTIFGTPTDQLTVSKLITDAEINLPEREEVRYYTMEERITDRLIDMLKEAVNNIPEVKRDETNPKVLVIRARPSQHSEIDEAIHRIKTELPEKEENTLKFYPLEKEQFDRFEQLRGKFEDENGQINILNHQDDRLMVWALPWQHEKLQKLLEQLQSGMTADDTKKVAQLYSPKYVDLTTLASVVKDLYSSVSVTTDADNNRLVLRGTVSKVSEATETLRTIDVRDPEGVKRSFASYDVKSLSSYDKNGNYYSPIYLVRDLQKLVPSAKVTYESYRQQIIVWGTEEDQQIVKEAIGNLNNNTTFNERFYRHEIRRASSTLLVSMVRQVFPHSTPIFDSASNSIVVQGNNVAMDEVKELLELLDPENPSPLDPTLMIYPFENEPNDAAVASLKSLAPSAKIEINKEQRRLLVIARPSEHKIIADNLKNVEGFMTTPEPVLAFYPYENEPNDSMMTTLKTFAPEAKIENLKIEKKLMVTAIPRQQKIIADTLGILAENSAPGDPVLKVYSFEKKPTQPMIDAFKKFAPDAQYELNVDKRQMMVIGRPAEIAKIDENLEAVTATLVSEEPELQIYPLEQEPTALSASYLMTLAPNARIYPDRVNRQMMVIAKPSDQKIIAENIGAIAKTLTATDPVLKVYQFETTPSPMASYYLMRLAPNARVEINKDEKQLLVIARPEDQKIIEDSIETVRQSLTEVKPVLAFYPFENEPSDSLMETLRKLAPEAKIDVNKIERRVIVVAKPADQMTVSQNLGLIAKNSVPSDQILKIFDFENEPNDAMVNALKKFAPDATYEINALRRQLLVVGKPAEMERIEANIDAVKGLLLPTDPVVAAYPLESQPTPAVAFTLMKMVPDAQIYPDYSNRQLLVIAKPKDQKRIAESIGSVAKAVTPTDPVVKVYPCENEPSPMAAYYLMKLAPLARVEVNRENRQIVVIARPTDQELIAASIESVVDNLSPSDPKLAIYPFENEPSQDVVDSLKKLAPEATITVNKESRQILVVAVPAKQKIIAENIDLVAKTLTSTDPTLRIFPFENEPTASVVDSLKKLAPEATVEIDKNDKQLMVIAKPSEMRKIESSLESVAKTFRKREMKMIAYPIYGMDTAELQKSLAANYPDMTIDADTQGNRLLIRGTLDEHVKVSEEIAQINKGADGGEMTEYAGPQVAVYQAANYTQSFQLSQMVKTLFPSVEIFADTSYYSSEPKVTIIAGSRDQKKIAEIFEQIKNPLNEEKMTLETYPIGELEPAAVEATLKNMLADSVSGSPIEIQRAAGGAAYRNYLQSRQNGGKQSFYRVDPKSKLVAVFATEKDLDQVRDGLEKMILAAGEPPKMISKVFTLTSPIAASLLVPLRELAPTGQITLASVSELIAYATENDMKKIDDFMTGVADFEGADTHYQFKSVFLPEGSLYDRATVVSAVTTHFLSERGRAYPAANANQVVLYGTNRVIEKMEKYIAESCKVTEKESYKTYPIVHIPVTTALALLTRLCPNATITPDAVNKTITILGSVFTQDQVAEALAAIDVEKTGDAAFSIRYYDLDEMPKTSYTPIYSSLYYFLNSQCPGSVLLADPNYYQFIVVATEKDHAKIAEFYQSMKEKRLVHEKRLETYHLKTINLAKAAPILQTAIPTALLFAGKRPNEFFVWAEPTDQEMVRETLAKLETIEENGPTGMTPKIYPLTAQAVPTVLGQIARVASTAYAYPLPANRLLIWGSESDHQLIAELLGVVAEAFPEAELVRYSFKHIRLTDAYSFLYAKYYPEAIVLYPSTEGDLLVQGPKTVQEKIAKTIAELDVPRPEEAEPVSAAYDVSDIPTLSQAYAISSILRVVPDAVFLPTVTPGYFVIHAKPEAQKKVAKLVAELVKEQPWLKARMEKYPLKNTTYIAAIALLRPLAPAAQFAPAREPNQMFVYAKAQDHERIADALAKLNEETKDGLQTRIYRLDRANLIKAQTTILSLYPVHVQSVMDPLTKTLTVNATPEYQAKINELLQELDRVDKATQPSVRVFSLAGLSYTSILMPIRSFFATDPDFAVNYDTSFRSLVVKGNPEQLSFVENLIEQIRRGGLADPSLVFKTYTLRNPWSVYTINSVFSRQGRDVYMNQDYSTGKLIVMARPEEHTIIENILDALAPEKTQLAIFELVYVDPQTANNIITTMLENDGSFVDVQFDSTSNRLYIRANAKKLEEIRQFLIQAGEKGLEKMPPIRESEKSEIRKSLEEKIKIQGTGPFRTIQFEGELKDILEEVKKNWTRENPLNVIQQDEGIVQTEENPAGNDGAKAEAEKKAADEAAAKAEAEKAEAEKKAADEAAAKAAAEKAEAEKTAESATAPAPDPAPVTPPPQTSEGAQNSAATDAKPVASVSRFSFGSLLGAVGRASVPFFLTATLAADAQSDSVSAAIAAPITADSAAPVAVTPAPSAFSPIAGSLAADSLAATAAPSAEPSLATATAAAEPESNDESTPVALDPRSTVGSEKAKPNEAAPGVYVVLNDDGTMTITSNDDAALEEFQRQFIDVICRKAEEAAGATLAETTNDLVEGAGVSNGTIISSPPLTGSEAKNQDKNIRWLAQQNTEEARKNLVMEDRNYSVYRVKEVSVDMMVQRLQVYMADRINPPASSFRPSYASQSRGISVRTISTGPRLTFIPDRALNTVMVVGSKVDRDEAGAMIAVLDKPELFPQPITKPFKVHVKNTTVTKMAQHVLNAFQTKFMSTRLPGNLAPRISPNTESNTLEIYAPEALAKEISEYVEEMDKEILDDPNRKKVQVVRLEQINSLVLQKYINNLRANQNPYNFVSPYMINPYYYNRTAAPTAAPRRQF